MQCRLFKSFFSHSFSLSLFAPFVSIKIIELPRISFPSGSWSDWLQKKLYSSSWRCRRRGKTHPNEKEKKKIVSFYFQYGNENLFYFECESMRNILLIRESLCIQFKNENVNVDERIVYKRETERERKRNTHVFESMCASPDTLEQTIERPCSQHCRHCYLFFYFSSVFSSVDLFWSL